MDKEPVYLIIADSSRVYLESREGVLGFPSCVVEKGERSCYENALVACLTRGITTLTARERKEAFFRRRGTRFSRRNLFYEIPGRNNGRWIEWDELPKNLAPEVLSLANSGYGLTA